jgi:Fe-S-cluster containining protein
MDKYEGRSEEDLFINALQEEAREILAKVGSLTPVRMLIENCLDELRKLAPREDGTEDRSEEEIWNQIRETLLRAAYSTRPYCTRCGTCCETGSPTLLAEDIGLFIDDILKPMDVFTVRKREYAYNAMTDKVSPTGEELIKVKETPGQRVCIFYRAKDKSCTIYDARPIQCAKQECWNSKCLEETLDLPKLSRKDLLGSVPELWSIIERHEERCSYNEITKSIIKLDVTKGKTVEEIIELLSYDQHVREFAAEQFGLDKESLDFFFGRPLKETIIAYGLAVDEQPDGSFLLRPVEEEENETDRNVQ